MLTELRTTIAVLGLCAASMAQADSILVYEKTGADGSKVEHSISITGRWLRIDTDGQGKPHHRIMDTGRMLLFEVDDSAKSYKLTHMGKLYWPEIPVPKFMPVPEKQTVSDVRCQKVQEMGPEKPIAEHCMTAGGPLGLNARETKTLSRLFVVARRMGWDWPGVSTPDERQVSIQSRNLGSGVTQQFKSVKHEAIPDDRFKVPDDYKQIRVDQKRPPKQEAPETTEKKPDTAPDASAKPESVIPQTE